MVSSCNSYSSFNNVTLVFDDDKNVQAHKVTIIIEKYCIIYLCAMKSNHLIVFKFHFLQIIKIILARVFGVDVNLCRFSILLG